MAFPYLAEKNFEVGTNSEWDSETDTDSKLSIQHFTGLATRNLHPYRGAYAAFIDLSLGTNDAYLEETGDFDLAADATFGVRFFLYASGLTMAASDRFTVFALQSGAGTDEVTVSIRNNAGILELVASETSGGATVRATSLVQNKWHCIELDGNIDAGGGNDGDFNFYVDGEQVGAIVSTLDQGAITQARFGAFNLDAGTTSGYLVLDWITFDDLRVGPVLERFPSDVTFTKSGHLFVGPGAVTQATIVSTTAGNTLDLYDTDTGTTSNAQARITELAIGATGSSSGPMFFKRGCYVALGGTNPRGQVSILDTSSHSGAMFAGPNFYSQNGYKQYASQRRQRPGNA